MSFGSWVARGFASHALLPIIPPGALLSPNSTMTEAACGKAPGLPGSEGWHSYNWRGEPTTERQRQQAEGAGCNIGLLAAGYPALDIDVLDEALAQRIEAMAVEYLGKAPCRIGRYPKRLLAYRANCKFAKTRLKFKKGDEDYIVELLADGQQYVVEGMHPVTKSPYQWQSEPRADELNEISAMDADMFMSALHEMLAEEGWTVYRGNSVLPSDSQVSPEYLDAPSEAEFKEAIKLWPNTTDFYPKREDYIGVAYAIKAAGRQWPETAEACWLEWCGKWEGGNDLDTAQSDWERCKPPHRLGWTWIESELVRTGVVTHAKEFGIAPESIEHAPFAKMLPLDFDCMAIAKRQWVLGTRFLSGAVTGGYGAPGVSKSTMSILTAIAIASGREDLTDEEVHRPGVVWIHNNEDDEEELYRRIGGVLKHYKIPLASIRHRLLLSSGAVKRLRVAYKDRDTVMIDASVAEIIGQIKASKVVFMAVDPFVSTHDGIGENDNESIEKVVMAFRRIAQETGCAIDLVHHTVKNHSGNTESRAGDMNASRGASALNGAVRCAYTLSPMSEKTGELLGIDEADSWRYVRLDMAKGNYSPRDRKPRWFELMSVDLGNGGDGIMDAGDSVGVPVSRPDLNDRVAQAKAEKAEMSEENAVASVFEVLIQKTSVNAPIAIKKLAKDLKTAKGGTAKYWETIIDTMSPLGAAHPVQHTTPDGEAMLLIRTGATVMRTLGVKA